MPLVWTWKIHSKDKEYSWGGKSFSARISKNQVLDTKGLVEVTLNEFQDHQVFQDHLNLYILLSILRLLKKKMSVWGNLKYSCHRYLSWGGGRGGGWGGWGLLCYCKKRLKIKCGFEGSISDVDLGLFQSKKPINV